MEEEEEEEAEKAGEGEEEEGGIDWLLERFMRVWARVFCSEIREEEDAATTISEEGGVGSRKTI